MKTTWAIEKDLYEDNTVYNLVDSLKKFDYPYFLIDQEKSYSEWEKIAQRGKGNTLFYGSIQIAEKVRREKDWIPGVFYTEYVDDCSCYYPHLSDLLLNADSYIMLPYGELIRKKEFIFDTVGQDGCVFIRPNSGKKEFTGKMINIENYELDVDRLSFYGVVESKMCVISAPRNIRSEWRFIVCDNEVITGSLYKQKKVEIRSTNYPKEAFELAEQVAKRYSIDRVWSCDICETYSGEFYMLELGCFSCSGLYECNTDIIVEKVSKIALEEYEKKVDKT